MSARRIGCLLILLLFAGCASSSRRVPDACELGGGHWVKGEFPHGLQCVKP